MSNSYTETTKQRIFQYVVRHPGHTGREIADLLRLDKRRVNSFLYSEGKRRFGLQVLNWRWSATGVATAGYRRQPIPISVDSPGRQMPTISICGAFSRMSITDATLKIRGMNEEQINLAFAEDDYVLLDDRLQAELAMRRSELITAKPIAAVSTSPFNNPLIWIGLGLMAVLFLGNVISNSPSNRLPQRSTPNSAR